MCLMSSHKGIDIWLEIGEFQAQVSTHFQKKAAFCPTDGNKRQTTILDEINYSDGISKFIFDSGVHQPPFDLLAFIDPLESPIDPKRSISTILATPELKDNQRCIIVHCNRGLRCLGAASEYGSRRVLSQWVPVRRCAAVEGAVVTARWPRWVCCLGTMCNGDAKKLLDGRITPRHNRSLKCSLATFSLCGGNRQGLHWTACPVASIACETMLGSNYYTMACAAS
ncbi:hypothetical protein T06_11768 [Trichinella sp. T6]|nr:hypothetical protein T06_11768 [Trichinella sp. T6]